MDFFYYLVIILSATVSVWGIFKIVEEVRWNKRITSTLPSPGQRIR